MVLMGVVQISTYCELKTIKTNNNCGGKMKRAFLIGKNVYLRPLEREDLKGPYSEWINDLEVTRYMEAGAFPVTNDDLETYFEQNLSSRNSVIFAIIVKKSEKHIGNARIYNISWVHRTAVRGIMIGDKSAWNEGYGLEVINLLSEYAFKRLNLNKLNSGTSADNIGINKVNERAGYKQEGILREEYYIEGRYCDFIRWGLLKSDYLSLKEFN